MPAKCRTRSIPAIIASLLLFTPVISGLLAQGSQTSPTPSVSPVGSPSITPARSPSPTPLPGAQNFHQWGSITVFNGLPSDSVRAIAQTPDGVMWFGTDNGLARFDGRRVQNFSLGEGDSVNALKTSPSGELWIGTRNGAYVYSSNQFNAVDGMQGVGVTTILVGAETILGTDTGQLLRPQIENGMLKAESLISEPIKSEDRSPLAITSLVQRGGEILAGTSGRGVFVLRDNAASVLPSTPRPEFVNSLTVSKTGALWLGADAAKGVSGIYELENSFRGEKVAAPTAKVLTLETNDDGLWAGTERYGLFQVEGSKLKKNYTFENTSGGLRSNTIYSIFTDREGIVWIGTNRGVSRYDPQGPIQQTVSEVPNSNFIRTLFRASDGSIFAGSNRGLFVGDGTTWKEVPGQNNKVVYSLIQNPSSTLIGTANGVFDLSGKWVVGGDTRGFASFSGRLYAAVYGRGVVDINSDAVIFQDDTATSVLAGKDRLWIGTAGNGLFSFDGKTIKNEASPDTLKSGTIWKMSEMAGRLLIAGQHGVFIYGDGVAEQVVQVEDVRDVLFEGADLWAATTTRGLVHARQDDRFGWLVSTIGFEQGLPSEKAFCILPLDNKLLIATNRGVVKYLPSNVTPKLIATRVLSQRLHDLGELASSIALEYPQNSLLVEVAGLSSRTFPEEFQYSFLLKNADGDAVDQRFSNDAQYNPTELKPGDYMIESVAYDRDLNASEPLSIKFSIARAPFPWTATALGVLLALAVIGLVWAAFEHRRIRQRNRELAAARFDLANEAERERSRIARDLHDQTLADLRNLMMKSDKGALLGPELREEIESVSTEIRRICEDLSPSVLENVGLVPALEFLLSSSIENHSFSADEGIEDRIQFPLNAQLQIYRIAQEVLANIRRHSNADLVEMSVKSTDDEFDLRISDNGTAFQPDGAMGKGRGIANIRSRANLIGGKVGWKDRSKGGNIFLLRIPRN